MTVKEQNRVQQLLKAAMPSVADQVNCELRRDLWRNLFSAGVDRPDNRQQLVGGYTFQRITAGTSLQCPVDFRVSSRGRQNHNASVAKFLPNGNNRLNAADSGNLKVHQSDVWAVCAIKR